MPPTEEDIAWFQSTFRPIPKPTLPDDCIEYSIFVISSDLDPKNDSELRIHLHEVQKYAVQLQKQWLKDYIWQRQGFSLEIAKEDGEVGILENKDNENSANSNLGISILRGRTEYGDSIEDEWVIVWLLREVTKKFRDVWIKVTDSDGEFLLIEASGTIPPWLEPDIAENRVWINDGQLKIIRPANATKSSRKTSEKLTLHQAQHAILNEPKRMMHSDSIEDEAFYRIRNYPGQIKQNMHHTLALLPRKVVYLLQQKPAYISPAVEAFYLRDPIALKPLRKPVNEKELLFPPNDLVTMSVKFPKVGYAQVKSQDFPVPPVWISKMPSQLDEKVYSRAELGMKITSGFEMLLSDSQHQDKKPVREMKMLLDDLDTGDETLPTNSELAALEMTEDDEKWLDIEFEDLEQELGGKSKTDTHGRKREFGDKAAQENLQRIVKQFEEFLNNDQDGPDIDGMFGQGSEDDDDDDDDDDAGWDEDKEDDEGEDKDASFDEDEFTRIMQEMMGMPPEVMKELMTGRIDALSKDSKGRVPPGVRERAISKIQEIDTSDEEDAMDMKQMEEELRASEALDLDHTIKAERSSKAIRENPDADLDSSDDEQGVNDFDAQFARNILQSFKSGGGMGGPAANLLSMMSEQPEGSNQQARTRQ